MRTEWPRRDSVPRRRHGATGVPMDDNVAVYDDVGQLLILLNPGAAAVWERCDGTTTFGALVAGLVEEYRSETAAAIEEDVRLTVRKLADLGLVESGHVATGQAAG